MAAVIRKAPEHYPEPGAAARAPGFLRQLRAQADAHTLGLWAARYLNSEVVGVQSPNTLAAKARDIGSFIRWYIEANGQGDIGFWMPRDTQRYLDHLERLGRAATSVNRALAHLRHFARWCHEQPGSLFAQTGLPTRSIKELATDEAPCKKLDEREMHLLLKAADAMVEYARREDGSPRHKNARPQRNRALLVMLQQTGLRISEAVRLQRRQYVGSFLLNVMRKGKARTPRLYLTATCRKALDSYLETEWRDAAATTDTDTGRDTRHAQPAVPDAQGEQHEEDAAATSAAPLFLGVHGEALDRRQVNRIFKKISQEASKHQEAQIRLHPHRLRHTFGDRHRAKSGSDAETATALGHASQKYVGRYIRKTDAERHELLEGMFE